METWKTETDQADLGIFTHILTYSRIFRHIKAHSGIIQAYLGLCVKLPYSEPLHIENQRPFRTLVYLEFWYIENPGIFRSVVYLNSGIFRIMVYCEFWYIENLSHIQNLGILRTQVYSELCHVEIPRYIQNPAYSNIYDGAFLRK